MKQLPRKFANAVLKETVEQRVNTISGGELAKVKIYVLRIQTST